MSVSRPVIVFAIVGLAAAAVLAWLTYGDLPNSEPLPGDPLRHGSKGEVGETLDFAVLDPGWPPLRWQGNDLVVFRTEESVVTVTLDGEISDPRSPQRPRDDVEPARYRLPNLRKFGTWTAWDGGIYLVREDEKCGPPLVPSPDGEWVACIHNITEPIHETNTYYAAVVRLR